MLIFFKSSLSSYLDDSEPEESILTGPTQAFTDVRYGNNCFSDTPISILVTSFLLNYLV